jgi:hypothetical protein
LAASAALTPHATALSWAGTHAMTTPRIAVCLTGMIDQSFSETVENLRESLVSRLEQVGNVDLFFSVKTDPDLPDGKLDSASRAAVDQLRPRKTNIYDQAGASAYERDPGKGACPSGVCSQYVAVAWLQRSQWRACWTFIEEAETADGTPYDFVVRTRPDLLYDSARFRPHEWGLWRDPTNSTGHGTGVALCKCVDVGFLDKPSEWPVAPIIDVFYAAPRAIAAVIITTRITPLTPA